MASPPLRRRIERACDQCRRRKTKCDGDFKCRKCSHVGLQCSYGERIKQLTGQKYVAHLEQKLEDLETRCRKLSSSAESTSQDGISEPPSATTHGAPPWPAFQPVDLSTAMPFNDYEPWGTFPDSISAQPARDCIETLGFRPPIETVGGHIPSSRGRTTGLEIMRRLRCLCDSFEDPMVDSHRTASRMVTALDSAPANQQAPMSSAPNLLFLSETSVQKWIRLAFDEAFVLWPFIDRHAFDAHAQSILERGAPGQDDNDKDHLGLFHAVIALGQRHDSDIVAPKGSQSSSMETRGIQNFAAARDLVSLADCSRNITAVQTVLCMALYLMSVFDKSAAHTYIGVAGHAAHQLGLHQAAEARYLSEKQRMISQRIYMATRTFDAYITSCLGLPRNLRANEPIGDPTDASYIGDKAMLAAASANTELLEILNNARENIFFTGAVLSADGSTVIKTSQLDEVGGILSQWASKHRVSGRIHDFRLADCTMTTMLLRYSHCFVSLMLYSPILHHAVKSRQDPRDNAYTYGCKCVEAAIEAICVAETLGARGMLRQAYAFTVDVLAMASLALLVVECGAPDHSMIDRVGDSSGRAKVLLEMLAPKSNAAAECLEALKPLYQSVNRTSAFSNTSAAYVSQNCFTGASDIAVWEPPQQTDSLMGSFDAADSDMMATNLQIEQCAQAIQWGPAWGQEDFAGSVYPSVAIDF